MDCTPALCYFKQIIDCLYCQIHIHYVLYRTDHFFKLPFKSLINEFTIFLEKNSKANKIGKSNNNRFSLFEKLNRLY